MKTVVDTSALPTIDRPGRICILQSKWYPELVQSMTAACQQVLAQAGYADVQTHTLPGSLEIPLRPEICWRKTLSSRLMPSFVLV